MKTRPHVMAMSLAALGLSALAACSNDASAGSETTSQSATEAPASATDVAFAQSMIPHHQQAVVMADLALEEESGASQQVQELATQIKNAQDPEIQQMTQWLQAWQVPTSMPGATDATGMAGMDHSGHDMGGMDVSGMMTADQMEQLQDASGARFDQLWLAMMIDHHEGAVEMAEQVESSRDPEVQQMAENIISTQQEEIAAMQTMLADGQ